jgi:hypothetical protein
MISLDEDAYEGPTGDNSYMDTPIGFIFNYCGTAYTQARISTNGWLSLNMSGNTTGANTRLFTSTLPNTTLAPWFDDLKADSLCQISYKTTGSSPFRVFTVEWKNILVYKKSSTARINFQLKLFETSDIIEFHYGNYIAGDHYVAESASIGIEDPTGGTEHFIEATSGSRSNPVVNLISLDNWPTVNYRFSPPRLENIYNDVVINNPEGIVNFNINTKIYGSFQPMPGSSFRILNGKVMVYSPE